MPRKDISCYHCGKSEHMRREHCKLKLELKAKSNEMAGSKRSIVVVIDNEIVFFSACKEESVNLACQKL